MKFTIDLGSDSVSEERWRPVQQACLDIIKSLGRRSKAIESVKVDWTTPPGYGSRPQPKISFHFIRMGDIEGKLTLDSSNFGVDQWLRPGILTQVFLEVNGLAFRLDEHVRMCRKYLMDQLARLPDPV